MAKRSLPDGITVLELHPQVIPYPIGFEEQHSMAVDLATAAFLRCCTDKEDLAPAWAAYSPNGFKEVPGPALSFCVTPWRDARHKDVLLEALRSIFKDIGAIRYSFWAEAWFVTRTDREYRDMRKADRPVSEQDDRREMLNVITVEKDRDQPLAAHFEIIRPWDGGLPSLAALDQGKEPFDRLEGRMCELLK